MLPEGHRRPPGAGAGACARSLTGQKRRRRRVPSPIPPSAARIETTGHHQIGAKTPSDSAHELGDREPDEVGEKEFHGYLAVLRPRIGPAIICGRRMDDEEQVKVDERLALYRIRASKLAQGVCADELDDVTLRKEYSPEALEEMRYFVEYNRADTVDWYFDSDYSKCYALSDYQRLVVKKGDLEGCMKYVEWEKYHSWFTRYEVDEEYIRYFEEVSKKLKWIKRYVRCDPAISNEFEDAKSRAFKQAVKIALDFPHMNYDLAFTALLEHIYNMCFESNYLDDFDLLLLEIWKHVTKLKVDFNCALDNVLRDNMAPLHKKYKKFVENYYDYSDLESAFFTCVEGIPDEALEGEAHKLIKSAVWNKLDRRHKLRNDYLARKIEICKDIGLDLQATDVSYTKSWKDVDHCSL